MAWNSLENGLEVQPPVSWLEKGRQPLFLNRFSTSTQWRQRDKETSSYFKIWAVKGITNVGHHWDSRTNDWKSIKVIKRITKSNTTIAD